MRRKYFIVLGVFLLVSASGCIEMDDEGDFAGFMGIGEPEEIAVEEISISAEPTLYNVDSGQENTVFFDIENRGNITVEDVDLHVFDMPHFVDDGKEKEVGELEPGMAESWEWDFVAEEVDSDRTSNIRYRLGYVSEAYAEHSVTVLSYDEYLTRQDEGDLEADLRYAEKETSVDIELGFSQSQPFVEDEDFLLSFRFENVGDGSVQGQVFEEGSVTLSYPTEFLDLMNDCQGVMDINDGEAVLDEELYFYEGQTSEVSCRFEVETEQDLTEDVFEISAEYKYIVDDYFVLTVES